jgi:hypothetical protein
MLAPLSETGMPEPKAADIATMSFHCEKKLKEAELKVEKIVLGPDGPKGLEKADDL